MEAFNIPDKYNIKQEKVYREDDLVKRRVSVLSNKGVLFKNEGRRNIGGQFGIGRRGLTQRDLQIEDAAYYFSVFKVIQTEVDLCITEFSRQHYSL